ncbi:MAG: hypothetical protein JWL64_1974, partial [Frankiales bacterium]|nr:hypothetical protein [Frankiales bacterium]
GLPHFEDKKRRIELWDLLLDRCHQLDMRSWEDVFARDADVFAEVFRDGAEVLRHPQLVAFEQVIDIQDPVLGTVRQLAPAVRIGEGVTLTRSAPAPDADGEALRGEPTRPPAPAAPVAPAGGKPLEGVTILELGILFAGPFGATLLADLGATVIKVESLEGDPIRRMAAFPESGGMHVLQGKKSIAVDFTTEDGCRIVKELAARSDIVLQSFRPGAVERHGLDVASLREVNPQLVYLDALAYGRTGPQALRPAFAPSIGAAAGVAMRNVHRADYVREDLSLEEIKSSARRLNTAGTTTQAQADGLSGNVVATGLLLGLLARKRSGVGVDLCTTMLASTAHALSDDVIDYADRPALPSTDAELLGLTALYRLYQAREGWVFLAAPQPREWAGLVKGLRSSGLEEDGRFSTAEDRADNDGALAGALAAIFRSRTAAEWEQALLPSGVGCVAVSDVDPECQWIGEFGREGNYTVDVEHDTFETHPRMVPHLRFSRSSTVAGGSPLAGAHTDELLDWLGYDGDRVSAMRAAGVVA